MAANATSTALTLNIDVKPVTITFNGSGTPVTVQAAGQATAAPAQAANPASGQAAPAGDGKAKDKKTHFQQKLEDSQTAYDKAMGGYNFSLKERTEIGLADGIPGFVESWKTGIMSVVNKQESIGSAFQKMIIGMRTKLRDFFLQWAAEQVAVGAMDLLGIRTKPKDTDKAGAKAGGDAKEEASAGKEKTGGTASTTSAATDPTAAPGFFDAIGSYLKPDSLLGTIWSKISSLFSSNGLLGGLMSGISGLFSSLFSSDGLLGGLLSGLTSFVSLLFHSGGIVGDTARPGRMVSAGLFAGAPRFHGGGLVAGEVPIIARKGEAVFTPEQMTNADRLIQAAQSGGGAVTQSVTVNVAGGSSGDREQDKALAERIGASVKEQLRALMGNELRQQMRPGGMLNNMSYGG